MTHAEWLASSDPAAMIGWLAEQGYDNALWMFATMSCRRVWHELPNETFHNVVSHVEEVGAHNLDHAVSNARLALVKLERRFHKLDDEKEQSRLSRQMGYAKLVLAFDHQDGEGVASNISEGLLAWADDADAERQTQAQTLRELVADPTQPAVED